jgi:hypothetical protein
MYNLKAKFTKQRKSEQDFAPRKYAELIFLKSTLYNLYIHATNCLIQSVCTTLNKKLTYTYISIAKKQKYKVAKQNVHYIKTLLNLFKFIMLKIQSNNKAYLLRSNNQP